MEDGQLCYAPHFTLLEYSSISCGVALQRVPHLELSVHPFCTISYLNIKNNTFVISLVYRMLRKLGPDESHGMQQARITFAHWCSICVAT